MTPEQRHRRAVHKYAERLLEISSSIKGRTLAATFRQLHAFDVACLETAFYAMCAHDEQFAVDTVNRIMSSILASNGNPRHWRHREARAFRSDHTDDSAATTPRPR